MPLWALVLEAANDDPLRAMELEDRVSQEWWDRWLVLREERIRAQPRRGGRSRGEMSAPAERQRHMLTPDGRLVAVDT